jgi:hypothetical protein
VLGIWNGEGDVSLRATWDQGGWDRITPKEGFQVSKGEWKGGGGNKEPARGVKKGELHHSLILLICICAYITCMNEAYNLMCLGYK